MITRNTVIDQIELRQEDVGVRLALQLVEDGEVISQKYHRLSIPYGVASDEIEAYFASVNDHLQSMKEAPISADDMARIVSYI